MLSLWLWKTPNHLALALHGAVSHGFCFGAHSRPGQGVQVRAAKGLFPRHTGAGWWDFTLYLLESLKSSKNSASPAVQNTIACAMRGWKGMTFHSTVGWRVPWPPWIKALPIIGKKNQSNCITVQKVTEVQERSSSWFVFLLEVILNWESWSEIGTIYWKQGKKTNRNSNILIIKNVQREGDSHAKTWYDGKKMMDRPFAHYAFLRL